MLAKRVSLKQKIYTELQNRIVFGQLAPGRRVREADLSEEFGCSRGPVREAFIQLENEGFLELNPNQGAVVRHTSAQEVLDFYALLAMLESEAVRLATPRLTAGDFKELKRIHAAIQRIAGDGRGSVENWIPLNAEFHRRFRMCCGNSRMDWLVEEIRRRITRYRYTSLLVTACDEYVIDHKKIIEAALRKDAEAAAGIMKEHIDRAKTVLMGFLSRFPEF